MEKIDSLQWPIIETEKYLLRKLTEEDATDIFAYFSDDEVTKYYDCDSFKSMEDALNFIASKEKTFLEGKGIRWGITNKNDTAKIIGTIGYHKWNKDFYKAEIGYDLSKDYWGQGVMSDVIPSVIEFGFNHMSLNRIEAQLHPDNIGSKRVLEKAGFKYEATLEDFIFLKGNFLDTVLMSLLKKNYK